MDTNINIEDIYYDKYIKYKNKYLELKEQSGGEKYRKRLGLIEYNNEKYLLPIEIIYSLLIKILDIFIPEDIQKIPEKPKEKTPEKQNEWYFFYKKTKIEEPKIEKLKIKEEIIKIFKSIKEYLKKSYIIYNNLYNRITTGIGNDKMFECCNVDVINIKADIKNKKNDIINSIQEIKNNHKEELNLYGENFIKQIKLYLSMQYKNELHRLLYNRGDVYYNHFSNEYDNEYDKELKLLFPNENYKHEINGFNNLEYIINYYFYKIDIGIQSSHVYILNNKVIKYNLSKTCFYNLNINISPPDPPHDILPLITNNGQVAPTRLPPYFHTIEMQRSSQKQNVPHIPPPQLQVTHHSPSTQTVPVPPSSNKDSVPPRPPRPSKDLPKD